MKPLNILFFLLCFNGMLLANNWQVGGRSAALSHASISLSDNWSTFHNQAGLAGLSQISTSIFHESRFLLDELSLNALSVIIPAGRNVFGLSYSQFGKAAYRLSKVGIALAKPLSKYLNVGIQIDYFGRRFPENSTTFSCMTIEGGIIFSPDNKLFIGAHSFNPISKDFNLQNGKIPLPSIVRLGAHYLFKQGILLTSEFRKEEYFPLLFKSGIEYCPLQNFVFRLGASLKPLNYTTGIGYTFGCISSNLAFAYHGNLGLTPSFSFQIRL